MCFPQPAGCVQLKEPRMRSALWGFDHTTDLLWKRDDQLKATIKKNPNQTENHQQWGRHNAFVFAAAQDCKIPKYCHKMNSHKGWKSQDLP